MGSGEQLDALGPGDPKRLGPFELTRRLGAGGMGTVYLGRRGSELAAVKAITPALANSSDFRARFRREIDVCARVRGHQVAALVDADADGPQPWLAVQYIPGPTLDQAIGRHGPLEHETLDGFALAVAEALRQIHQAGVVHRDLKPSNVILTPATPVIIDFGIAGVTDATSLTATGTVMGSAGWMSPEQVLGHGSGPAADVFAWGALVAYAATGRPPFGHGRPEALTYRVVHGSPDLDGIPDRLLTVVSAALSTEPTRRPTVTDLILAMTTETSPTTVAHAIASTWVSDDITRLTATSIDAGSPPVPVPQRRRALSTAAFVAALVVIIAVAATAITLNSGGRESGSDDATELATATADSEDPVDEPEAQTPTTPTEASTTPTTSPPASTATPATTTEAPPPEPSDPVLEANVAPYTTDFEEVLGFAIDHEQQVVRLNVGFDETAGFTRSAGDFEGNPYEALTVCGSEDNGFCNSGIEILVYDLDIVPDASLGFMRGQQVLRGRFAVQAVTGPFQGLMSIAVRAVPVG